MTKKWVLKLRYTKERNDLELKKRKKKKEKLISGFITKEYERTNWVLKKREAKNA